MNYVLHLLIFASMYVILALSLDLVMGYMGRFNLGHAAFVAVGGYTYALVTVALGWGFIPALVVAVGVAVMLSPLLSLPAWRFKGDLFIMLTLVVQTLVFGVIHNWGEPGQPVGSWRNFTNGPFGIAKIPKPDILGISLDTMGSMAVFSLIVAGVCALIVFRLTHSPWGRLLKCARDDELALRGLGKDVRRLKVQAFAFSCALAAVGGVIYASYVSYIDPKAASLDASILLLCMLCVGGMGNFREIGRASCRERV